MERDFFDDAPCSSIAVDSVIRMGTAGVIWGSCVGPFDANKLGLTGIARASFVAKLVGQYGLKWGFFAAIFSFTHCGIQRYRGKKIGLILSLLALLQGQLLVLEPETGNRLLVSLVLFVLCIILLITPDPSNAPAGLNKVQNKVFKALKDVRNSVEGTRNYSALLHGSLLYSSEGQQKQIGSLCRVESKISSLVFLDDQEVAQLPAIDYQYQETDLYIISAELSIHGHGLSPCPIMKDDYM